jgi:EAL domain-containing protein (putative c-di-GMP-specific phosphodiesterase class I)
VSLNVLPQEIGREGFEQWLLDEIGAVGIDPARVVVEITENALLDDQPAVATRLARLRERGVQVAIDDFGTGYASLGYLTALPLDMIKLDRGLVADLAGGERDRIVVKAIIRLARELDLKVVVEGVENTAQLALIADWGCDLYQGFLGAGALTQDELIRFVATAEIQAA